METRRQPDLRLPELVGDMFSSFSGGRQNAQQHAFGGGEGGGVGPSGLHAYDDGHRGTYGPKLEG